MAARWTNGRKVSFMVFEFGQYTVDVDVARTREFYRNARRIDQDCHCDGCRNYVKAVDTFPENVLTIFSDLGIDPKKTPEMWVNDPDHHGLLLYHGFYHLCGTILSGVSAYQPQWDYQFTFHITQKFYLSFEERCDLLEAGFPLPAIQMELDAEIPWVLEKSIQDISFDWR